MKRNSFTISKLLFFVFLIVFILKGYVVLSQPENSFFVIHCDPKFANGLHFNKLIQMVDTATAYNVPLTIEFSPQWVDMILADSMKLAKVRTWQANGHEVAAHHHGIFHCYWDSLTNYPPDSIAAHQPQSPACDSGVFKSVMLPFWNKLDTLAGDSLLLTWGSSDEHPAVDMYPNVPYRTDGGRQVYNAFSNPYAVTHEATIGNITYGPYTTCQIDYCFIDNLDTVNAIIALYNDTSFSNQYSVVGVVTHVFDFRASPIYFYRWIRFISGKGCKTVRDILRPVCSQLVSTDVRKGNTFFYHLYPNPTNGKITIQISDQKQYGEYELHIFSTIAQKLKTITIKEVYMTIDLSDLPGGFYFYRLESGRGKQILGHGKLVIQR